MKKETPREPEANISDEKIKEAFRILEHEGMMLYSEGEIYTPVHNGWKFLKKIK